MRTSSPRSPSFGIKALVALALGATGGCAPKNATPGGISRSEEVSQASFLTESVAEDGTIEQQVDINADGRSDVFNHYRQLEGGLRLLNFKEVDLNWDGRVDVRSWFDDQSQITKEEMDSDFDGRVDWVDHYQGGKRVLSEVDTDYDGAFDLFKIYEAGHVRRKERDSNGDGRIDVWEYLDDAGQVVKVGRDIDGDGVMDVRDD